MAEVQGLESHSPIRAAKGCRTNNNQVRSMRITQLAKPSTTGATAVSIMFLVEVPDDIRIYKF